MVAADRISVDFKQVHGGIEGIDCDLMDMLAGRLDPPDAPIEGLSRREAQLVRSAVLKLGESKRIRACTPDPDHIGLNGEQAMRKCVITREEIDACRKLVAIQNGTWVEPTKVTMEPRLEILPVKVPTIVRALGTMAPYIAEDLDRSAGLTTQPTEETHMVKCSTPNCTRPGGHRGRHNGQGVYVAPEPPKPARAGKPFTEAAMSSISGQLFSLLEPFVPPGESKTFTIAIKKGATVTVA